MRFIYILIKEIVRQKYNMRAAIDSTSFLFKNQFYQLYILDWCPNYDYLHIFARSYCFWFYSLSIYILYWRFFEENWMLPNVLNFFIFFFVSNCMLQGVWIHEMSIDIYNLSSFSTCVDIIISSVVRYDYISAVYYNNVIPRKANTNAQ